MNANVNETRDYYHSIGSTLLCDCGYCKNYRQQVRAKYPEVAAYLDALGVDIEKPFETSPLEPDEAGMLEYCGCQYVVFGNCPLNYRHQIGEVEFRAATSYPRTGIEREHFVLEFYPIRLKWNPDV